MNPVPELVPYLKQLRLSGILDSLEARNRQALDSKLAYTEFLALLIEDEVARREQKKFALRLRRASFRASKTLEQFDFERLPQLNRALVHELATGRYLNERVPVLIVGPCGTGKSHLAQALGHCAIRQGVDVLFTTCAQLVATLNAARATGGYDRKLASLARVPLLVIDDFGLKPLRPPADEDLRDLIAERYETAATTVTSNLDFTEWFMLDLAKALDADVQRARAAIAQLVGTITVQQTEDGIYAEMEARPDRVLLAATGAHLGLVAGAGFEPATFGL